MRKVLLFSLAYYPFIGGAEVAIKEITDRISPLDIEFHMVTLRFDSTLPRYEQIGQVHVHRIGYGRRNASVAASFSPLFYISKILFVPLAAIAALRLHRRNQFDGLWAMMSYMVLPIVLMRALGVRLPYALTLQEGDSFEHVFGRPRMLLAMPLLRSGFRNASVVQAISTFLGRWALAMRFEGPLEIIPNGVDAALFARALPRPKWREELGIHQSDTLLISASRLVRKNAIDDCIRALSMLPLQTHLVVLGEGPERTALEELALELGVGQRTHFLGSVKHADLPGYLRASDIFVRPSRTEGMGNAFIEAMAAGIPVIATQEGGIADFLFDRRRDSGHAATGFAVDRDDPSGIAEAVERIAGNPEEVRQVVENAQALAREHYDWNRIARDMRERVFSKLF